MFDEKYYEQEDKKAKKSIKQKGLDLKLMNDDEIMEDDGDDDEEMEEGEEE